MKVTYSDEFKAVFRKIRHKPTKEKIFKQTQKLCELPEAGKLLRNELKNHRSLRVHPFRIIYRIESDEIIVLMFDHRKQVYE
ncbi:MAG: type II toxin-antitoxin system RelE/ParE family toxin [Victivallaceae bacterium]|nr:type II toxin-antitoxin system RelE/ParE family toxin [Victivallaceae bacterium]